MKNSHQPQLKYAIKSREDLSYVVDVIDGALQSVNDYLKANPRSRGRIRFPQGQLGTLTQHLDKFNWIESEVLASNLANQYVFLDLLQWVLNRTDLMGSARTMLFKNIVVVCGSIVEALLDSAATKVGIEADKFMNRNRKLKQKRVIDTDLLDALGWLWRLRGKIHLHILEDYEQQVYKADDAKLALRITNDVVITLRVYFSHFVSSSRE
jgi:hypothetical protein